MARFVYALTPSMARLPAKNVLRVPPRWRPARMLDGKDQVLACGWDQDDRGGQRNLYHKNTSLEVLI